MTAIGTLRLGGFARKRIESRLGIKLGGRRENERFTGMAQLASVGLWQLEGQLIAAHSALLVNWINPGRGFDYAALERLHALRDVTCLAVRDHDAPLASAG